MRYRLLASYQGAPYEAGVGPADSDVVLFAACPPPEELRFEPATGHWRKELHLADVQTLHESRPVGMFRGERCVVLDDLNDRLHIVYLGHDAFRAEQIGYWEVDRGVFELITPRQEVTDIVEERLAFPHRGDGTWQTAAAYPASDPALGYSTGTPNGESAGPQTASYPSQGQDSFTASPQVAYDGPEATPTFIPRPGGADYEPPARGRAPGYAGDSQLADYAGGDDGQTSPGTGFGGMPDSGPANEDFAPAAERGAGSEPDPAPDLGPAPGYLTATDLPGVAVPMVDEPPLPLEAQALRAATASHRREQPDYPAKQIPQAPPAQDTLTGSAEPLKRTPPAAARPAERPQAPARQAQSPPQPLSAPQPAQGAPSAVTTSARHAAAAKTAPVQDARARDARARDARAQDAPLPTATPAQDPPAAAAPAQRPPTAAQPAPEAPASVIAPPREAPVAVAVQLQDAPIAVVVPFQDAPVAVTEPAQDGASAATRPVKDSPAVPTAPVQGTPTAGSFEDATPTSASTAREAPPATMPEQAAQQEPADQADSQPAAVPRRRRAAKRRLPTQRIFSDLTAQAAIPATAYAVGEDVDGAMCLMRTADGFEVFNSAAGARHEVRVFQDEESAYFYLFGVLVADAVRTGALAPRP